MKTEANQQDYDISQLIYPTDNAACRTFSIESVYYEYLRQLGGGNASKGLRLAVISCAKEHSGVQKPK